MVGDLIWELLHFFVPTPSGQPTRRDRRNLALLALVLIAGGALAWFVGAEFLAWLLGGVGLFILLAVLVGILIERWVAGSNW